MKKIETCDPDCVCLMCEPDFKRRMKETKLASLRERLQLPAPDRARACMAPIEAARFERENQFGARPKKRA